MGVYFKVVSIFLIDFNRYVAIQDEFRTNDSKEIASHADKFLLEMIATNKKLKEILARLRNKNNLLNQNAENLDVMLNQERKRKEQMRNY